MLASFRLILGIVEEHNDDAVEFRNLILEKVVLRDREPFDQVLREACRRPLSELSSTWAADPIANGQNGGQIVVFNLTGYLAFFLVMVVR